MAQKVLFLSLLTVFFLLGSIIECVQSTGKNNTVSSDKGKSVVDSDESIIVSFGKVLDEKRQILDDELTRKIETLHQSVQNQGKAGEKEELNKIVSLKEELFKMLDSLVKNAIDKSAAKNEEILSGFKTINKKLLELGILERKGSLSKGQESILSGTSNQSGDGERQCRTLSAEKLALGMIDGLLTDAVEMSNDRPGSALKRKSSLNTKNKSDTKAPAKSRSKEGGRTKWLATWITILALVNPMAVAGNDIHTRIGIDQSIIPAEECVNINFDAGKDWWVDPGHVCGIDNVKNFSHCHHCCYPYCPLTHDDKFDSKEFSKVWYDIYHYYDGWNTSAILPSSSSAPKKSGKNNRHSAPFFIWISLAIVTAIVLFVAYFKNVLTKFIGRTANNNGRGGRQQDHPGAEGGGLLSDFISSRNEGIDEESTPLGYARLGSADTGFHSAIGGPMEVELSVPTESSSSGAAAQPPPGDN